MTVAALFVQKGGIYYGIPDVDPWDEERDARRYDGPHPVIAHPPCQLWGPFAKINFKRWGGEHNRPGNDQGCFESALRSVRTFGGVLEHPAFSKAWDKFELPRPPENGWGVAVTGDWVCEVWQSAYGHKARKRTWLLYVGKQPPELNWSRRPGTHQCGFHDQRGKARNKPSLSKHEACATPIAFAEELVKLAKWAK